MLGDLPYIFVNNTASDSWFVTDGVEHGVLDLIVSGKAVIEIKSITEIRSSAIRQLVSKAAEPGGLSFSLDGAQVSRPATIHASVASLILQVSFFVHQED
jgi:hypothetical protein